jgi:hypothetical protein
MVNVRTRDIYVRTSSGIDRHFGPPTARQRAMALS